MATFGALKHRSMGAVWAVVALGIVLVVLMAALVSYSDDRTITAKVTHKQFYDNISGTDGDVSTFRNFKVYTDRGTFDLRKDFFLGLYDEYTLYNNIQTDSCYTFRVIGWNLPLLNIYSRIIEVHKVQ